MTIGCGGNPDMRSGQQGLPEPVLFANILAFQPAVRGDQYIALHSDIGRPVHMSGIRDFLRQKIAHRGLVEKRHNLRQIFQLDPVTFKMLYDVQSDMLPSGLNRDIQHIGLKLIDGVVWDGKDPAKYADGFKVKA